MNGLNFKKVVCIENIYSKASETALKLSKLAKRFPSDGHYSLTQEITRSSDLVCVNLAEAHKNKKNQRVSLCKLRNARMNATKTQNEIASAVSHGYLDAYEAKVFCDTYEKIINELTEMMENPKHWISYCMTKVQFL
jgi:four helix bundle protein